MSVLNKSWTLEGLKTIVRRRLENFRFHYGPRIAKQIVNLSTLRARSNLNTTSKKVVLIDNSVLAYATTHETAWISTGPSTWGEQTIDTGYMARIAVHPFDTEIKEYQHIRYFPGLISLHSAGFLQLCTSAELQAEQFRKPSGMFRGYGMYDLNLFC